MNIGYVYGFNSFSLQTGGSIHVHNLIKSLNKLGCSIHTFEPEENPQCVTYSATDKGIAAFLNNIDILYIRIDGWYLSHAEQKIRCMERIVSKPIVWEINASADERLRIESLTSKNAARGETLYRLRSWVNDLKIRSRIRSEERFRRDYAKMVDAAICVSSQLMEYAVEKLCISESVVVPNGSDPLLFSPEKKSEDLFRDYESTFKVIYIGDSRWPWQGIDYVKRLAAMARLEGHSILFVVLDNSPYESDIKGENLLVFRRVNYSDVPDHVASADLCLCLYKDFHWSSYGFSLSPLKLFDYMACEKPIVASALGQISTVIDDGKDGLLTTNDIHDIYDKILLCLEHNDKAQEMGRSARQKVVKYYNWERVAKSTIELFTALMRG